MWWVLTLFYWVATFTSLLVVAHTTQADHLFIKWGYYKPARHPIYRRIRGVNVLCGYKYIWDTPNLVEQFEPGDTLEHVFFMPGLRPASTIWFYIFAPNGPYGLEIQGPLMHTSLPIEQPPWNHNMFFASRFKGVYKTTNFQDDNPTWTPDNGEIPAVDYQNVRQACSDPIDPYHRRFVIAGGNVYRLENLIFENPAASTLLLTTAQASTLTGSFDGTICWVAGNHNFPGRFYVLFNSVLTDNGIWCIRTLDYGLAWQAYQITPNLQNYKGGNIMAGIEQGNSPHDPGLVLYAALNIGPGGSFALFMSSNNGFSWTFMDTKGSSVDNPRCLVDPYDQATVYMGAHINPGDPRELFRSEAHGAALAEVDGIHHLGIFTGLLKGDMYIQPDMHFIAKVLQEQRVWQTNDYCATWANPGLTAVLTQRMAIRPSWPNNLYLARDANAPGPPFPGGWHIIFASNDDGITMQGKSGAHPHLADGGGDSIPYDCGGAALTGIMPLH